MKRLFAAVAISTGLVGLQAAPASAAGAPYGAIGAKYYQLGGPSSFLGSPVTNEANGWYGGRYVAFQGGSIYWLPATGAHEVHGGIRTAWGNTGFEYGPLRYPTTDELRTPVRDGAGEFFQGGVVYWSPTTNAHAIYGGILATWQQTGWENRLGFPTTDEYNYGSGRRQNFEFGTIDWTPRGGAVANYWFFDKGWTLQTPFDIYNDYGAFAARNVRLTNNNPTSHPRPGRSRSCATALRWELSMVLPQESGRGRRSPRTSTAPSPLCQVPTRSSSVRTSPSRTEPAAPSAGGAGAPPRRPGRDTGAALSRAPSRA